MSKINFDIQGIGSLIMNSKFTVPNYQRAYKWEDEHINNMISDLDNAINNSENEYFLGTIVLSKKTDSSDLEIVDGQQRIISIIILISVIKDHFDSLGKKDISAQIKSDYISTFEIRSEENISKIKLSLQDRSFFQNYIINSKENEVPTKKSHERIINAKKLSRDYISKLALISNTNYNKLHDLIDYIKDNLKVVIITVPSETNAFTIFETLNDRGLILAQIDLLKNYLFSKSGSNLEEMQVNWLELSAKIEETTKEEELLLTYIKHFWSSRNGLTREVNKELYKKISLTKKTPSQVYDFVKELNEDSKIYLAIINHSDSFWNDYSENVRKYIETLNYFELEQYRPLLLTIIKRFDPKEVEKSLKIIVSWLVRNLITGSLGGGSLEKEYTDRAKDVFEGKITNAKLLRDNIKVIPNDKEFKEKFLTISISKDKYARYYLSAIENFKRDKKYPELLVNNDVDAVNLEHILPKKPHANWPEFTDEQVKTLHKRIGNLTLMKAKLNSEQGNAPFSEKIKIYKDSELNITKMILDYDNWNEDNIKDRQIKLAELAVETWSLKF